MNAKPLALATPLRRRRYAAGLTLIEALITMAIAGILSSVAVGGVQSYLRTARRSDALVAAMRIQAAQERYRSEHMSYGALSAIGHPPTSPSAHYAIALSGESGTGYVVSMRAVGSQERDVTCRHLRIEVNGPMVRQSSGPDASVANDSGVNRRCWGQ